MVDQISNVTVASCSESMYVRPFRMHYMQDGVKKSWDYIRAHDGIAVLLYNKDRDVFPLVKQFRPAVYAAKIGAFTEGEQVDTSKHRGELGMTLELCSGLRDKDKDVVEIAQMEILEETGYKVPKENLQRVTSYRSGIGTEGSCQTLFYGEVSDEMRVGKGGGVSEEGELLEVVDLSREDALAYAMDESIARPAGMMFAFMWFFFKKDIADSTS